MNWTELKVFEKNEEDVSARWLLILESMNDATHLKFVAEGKWEVTNSVLPDCDPDGAAGLAVPDGQLILKGCPFGALLGKIGGSTAFDKIPSEASDALAIDQPVAIGSFCQLKLPESTSAPLFIGFNSTLRPIRISNLNVKVYGARIDL